MYPLELVKKEGHPWPKGTIEQKLGSAFDCLDWMTLLMIVCDKLLQNVELVC
jgi:hypothetical protein